MSHQIVKKIISGGQTGVDRAALDVAIFLEIDHGGWCPAGRRAEDGKIPKSYRLKQTESRNYAVRTEQNVIDSDGTLILYRNELSGGTDLTYKMAIKHNRPLMCVDLLDCPDDIQSQIQAWLLRHQIHELNIAGPRESSTAGITREAERWLLNLFSR